MRMFPVTKVLPQTVAVPGYGHYLTPLRKLIFDYDPLGPSQDGMRIYLKKAFLDMARVNPDIEFVVRKQKRGKPSLLRGHYVNGRDKVICVNKLDTNQVKIKVDLLLNSSGAKIKHLKNLQLEAAPGGESARGIWSALHDQTKVGGGYRI